MIGGQCAEHNAVSALQDAGTLRMLEYREWLRFAKSDLDSAKCLNEGPIHPKPLEIICYHSQQAAEKAVKAVIVYLGGQGNIPKVHNIVFLLRQIKNILKEKKNVNINESMLERGERLTRYSIAPRYPGEIQINEAETRKALEDAEVYLQWAEDIIKP